MFLHSSQKDFGNQLWGRELFIMGLDNTCLGVASRSVLFDTLQEQLAKVNDPSARDVLQFLPGSTYGLKRHAQREAHTAGKRCEEKIRILSGFFSEIVSKIPPR